jgi:hypothetical protein
LVTKVAEETAALVAYGDGPEPIRGTFHDDNAGARRVAARSWIDR